MPHARPIALGRHHPARRPVLRDHGSTGWADGPYASTSAPARWRRPTPPPTPWRARSPWATPRPGRPSDEPGSVPPRWHSRSAWLHGGFRRPPAAPRRGRHGARAAPCRVGHRPQHARLRRLRSVLVVVHQPSTQHQGAAARARNIHSNQWCPLRRTGDITSACLAAHTPGWRTEAIQPGGPPIPPLGGRRPRPWCLSSWSSWAPGGENGSLSWCPCPFGPSGAAQDDM